MHASVMELTKLFHEVIGMGLINDLIPIHEDSLSASRGEVVFRREVERGG
jgi:hypothetical protein